MMNKLMAILVVFLATPAVRVLAQAQEENSGDVMLPESGIILPWIVGIGIFIVAVIVGFKNSGRTHLD